MCVSPSRCVSRPRTVGPKGGKESKRNGTNTFEFRCKSHAAWGCGKHVRVVETFLSKSVEVQDAVGWEHVHTGEFKLKRGLPPQLTEDIQAVCAVHPNIKLSMLRNHLIEVKGWSSTFSKQIEYYHYNHCPRNGMALGVSAFGTVATLVQDKSIDRMLAHVDADLNTTGVIGSELVADEGRLLVVNASIKSIMFAFEQLNAGYDNGLLVADFTYKIMKEKLAFLAMSTVDIGQHNKLIAFGPSSHEDKHAVQTATRFVKTFLDTLVANVKAGTLPAAWAPGVKELILKEYAYTVSIATRLVYTPETFLGDCADALGNGVKAALDSIEVVKSCYTHVWRAASRNLKKMKDSSDERVNMLFADLAFISETWTEERATLRAHEAQRLSNIAANNSFLAQVGLMSAADAATAAAAAATAAAAAAAAAAAVGVMASPVAEGELEGALVASSSSVLGGGGERSSWGSVASAAPSASEAPLDIPEGYTVQSYAAHMLDRGMNVHGDYQLEDVRRVWGPQMAQECIAQAAARQAAPPQPAPPQPPGMSARRAGKRRAPQ